MAILEEKKFEGTSGFKKKFEEGTEAILFDFIQGTQYQYPIPSAIRELVSNANDSIKEKKQFFLIDSGKKKVSDFYVEKEGDLFKDSKYQPEYYDKKWLSRTRDDVTLIYRVNNAAQRDSFHIIDTGVGLGGVRLEKHFNPLFSTKRLNTSQLGKFGVGSKAGLALDIDYYTLITRYNGLEFHFNVFNYKVDSIVPKFNLDKGIENEEYICQILKEEDGVTPLKFYAYRTEEMNGVEVILQAKKGTKKDFIDAVKGQLLYMEGIKFTVVENGEPRDERVKADIMYEDDVFVMPTKDSTYYSKPHIILGDVCYGYVNFLMLEEEDRVGNIGMKIDPSKVDITVNRESVRWTEKTRNAIHETFKKGEHIAERVMEQALNTEDLLDWLRKMQAWISTNDKDSIVGRFSNIVDVKNLRPTFKPIPDLGFYQEAKQFFSMMEIVKISSVNKHSKSRGYNFQTLERSDKVGWQDLGTLPVYIGDKDYRKEMYLLSIGSEYIRITPKDELLREESIELNEEEKDLVKRAHMTVKEWGQEKADQQKIAIAKAKFIQQKKLYELFRTSQFIQFYSAVVVPDDFKLEGHGGREGADEEEEEDAVVKEVIDEMSPEQRRKLEEKILVNTFDQGWYSNNRYPPVYRKSMEIKARTLLQDKAEVIYGFQEDEANLSLIAEVMGEWTKPFNHKDVEAIEYHSIYNDSLKIIMTSKANAKFLKPHLYVNDFFMSFNPETKTISMHNRLVKWQTARKVKAILSRLQFLKNFTVFDSEATIRFNSLCQYVASYDLNLKAYMTESKTSKEAAEEVVGNLESFADKITDLQLFIANHPEDAKAIGAKCKALFETDEDSAFEGALGVEIEVYQKAVELDGITKDVQLLLNQVDCLRSVKDIPYALEQEIRGYLTHKQYISLSVTQVASTEETVTQEAEPLNS